MINYAVVGLSDPRHRALLAPFTRRRAGIRPVAVADARAEADRDALEARDRIASDAGVPGFAEPATMLAEAMPSLVGVAVPTGAHDVVVDALDAGAAVLALPPLAGTAAELDDLTARVDAGAAITAVHTWRGHQTSTVAAELLGRGHLGALSGVALTLADGLTEQEVAAATYEVVDLFLVLSGARHGQVRVPVNEPAVDGEVMKLEVIAELEDGQSVRLEVWQSADSAVASSAPGGPPPTAYAVQVIGTGGTVEWDVRSGRLVSAIADREPVMLSCGVPDREADWVLATLVRATDRPLTGPEALVSTRILLQAKESENSGGQPQPW